MSGKQGLKTHTVNIESILMDTSIQCRASIDMGVVNDYADRISEGDKFPPVVLFGDAGRCWIGDGWHRIVAYRQLDFIEVETDLRRGGRADALKHALGANAIHGHRRDRADMRRCIEIALQEFPRLSNNAVAELCGVSDHTVASVRGPASQNTKLTGKDGKQYPAKRPAKRTAPREMTLTEESEIWKIVMSLEQDGAHVQELFDWIVNERGRMKERGGDECEAS